MLNEVSVGIIGTGSYVPDKIMTNKELEQIVDTSDKWIVERTGIRERRITLEGQATSDLATEAAKRALDNAGISADELDLIIVATITPDMLFPSVACLVQANLKATKAAAFDLSAACSGFVYGIVTASQFIKSGLYEKILVIGAENLSKILDWTDRNTCVLFGDGAGAAVVAKTSPGYGILGVNLGADGSGASFLSVPAGGSRIPASAETINNRQHFMQMNGPEVYKFAVKVMGASALKAIANANLSPADISYVVPHQANIRIIESAAKRLGISMDKVAVSVTKYANTSSASIPIGLDEAFRSGNIKKDDIVVVVGFGAGLTWASSVMKWSI